MWESALLSIFLSKIIGSVSYTHLDVYKRQHFDTELESDDVDTIAGYYLTGVGAIPTQEVKEHYSVINKDKHLEFINDKVKDGRVTKLKVIITAAPEEAEE